MSKKILQGLVGGLILWALINLILNLYQKNQSNNSKELTLEKCVKNNLQNEECKKLASDLIDKLSKDDIKSK